MQGENVAHGTQRPSRPLRESLDELGLLATALQALAERSPQRLTTAQVTFFLKAALRDVEGKATTFTGVRDEVGPSIRRSLHTTYRVFMEPSRNFPSALCWLEGRTTASDLRAKTLHLTAEGEAVLRHVLGKMAR